MLRYSPPLSPRHTLRLVNSRDNWRRSFQTIINRIVVAVLVSFLVLTKFLAFYTVGSDCWSYRDISYRAPSLTRGFFFHPSRLKSPRIWDHYQVPKRIIVNTEAIQRNQLQLADNDASLVCFICVDRPDPALHGCHMPDSLTYPGAADRTKPLSCFSIALSTSVPEGWSRTAHPSPADKRLAFTYTLEPRSSLFTLLRQQFWVRERPARMRCWARDGFAERRGRGRRRICGVWFSLGLLFS
ncbi:hypothetical protein B0H13DRAFT_2667418 [Mycena leptocephala]|nr:hypothetical protein B0H13DRAFT_2667418 [Mycena leptocephala]